MCAVYVPPSANADVPCDVINSAIARVQNQSPNAFIAVSGDFNHTSLSSCLPTFTQFVKCSTRENRTLDLLYANVKAAYNSKALPPLGRSDHNLVVLTPQYKPLVQRQPASTRSVRKWSPEAVESLQGCFASKTIRCFANNKPWVTSNLKHLLNQKKRAFKTGDKEELKRVQPELRIRIKEAKEEYRTKLETKLENNNTRDVWKGLKDITGFNLSSSGAITDGSYERANEFFLSFDNDSPTTTLSSAGSPVVLNLNTSPEQQPPPFTAHTSSIPNIYTSSDSPFTTPAQDQSSSSAPTFTADQVKKELKKLKQGKAAVPDGIRPKTDAGPLVRAALDPLQFAYQDAIRVDDAVIYLMDKVHSNLDTAGSAVRIMFFDFSSAFNTLQPVLLGDKLRQMQVDESIISWTMDYLTGRPQFVWMHGCVSDVAMCSAGAPQGTVLAPFLFNIYTSDFRYNSGTCHLQKFSDDTAIVGCIRNGQEAEYRKLVSDFVSWCKLNQLQLNISKTKEMVVDFRKNRSPQAPVTIDGEEVEVVGTYKYLGVHLDNKLDWSSNTSAVFTEPPVLSEETEVLWVVH
ncbi:hypothetical protein NFI96_016156 [Prochilodus magdalenae]|nr:hypothetical protein NFI96_016156 [Prochilodus magdalenae]